MYFTQEDYKKIENWLHRNSVKDTEFQEALPFTGKEIVTVVQDGHNRKVNIQEFINQLYKYGVEDFLNVTNTYRANNITLKEAIRLIPAEARKEGQVITFLNTDGNWEIYQFIGKLNQWNNPTLWDNPFDWEKLVVDSILPDEEDLTKSAPDAKGNSYLSLKNRKYEPDKYSGLGRRILRKRVVEIEDPIYGTQEKNLLLQADFAEDNTVYVVRYDFTLNGQDITLPDNSYIEYEGGSISDGNIIDRAGGLNRVVLNKNIINGKNILTQEMISKSNTIYEIRYDFDLNGETITLPNNCILKFEGGSLKNGTLIGVNTNIEAKAIKVFDLNLNIEGTWLCEIAYSEWFGSDPSGNLDSTEAIQKCINAFDRIYLPKFYSISSLNIPSEKEIFGNKSGWIRPYSSVDNIPYLFYTINNSTKIFIHDLNLWGLTKNNIFAGVNGIKFQASTYGPCNIILENLVIRQMTNCAIYCMGSLSGFICKDIIIRGVGYGTGGTLMDEGTGIISWNSDSVFSNLDIGECSLYGLSNYGGNHFNNIKVWGCGNKNILDIPNNKWCGGVYLDSSSILTGVSIEENVFTGLVIAGKNNYIDGLLCGNGTDYESNTRTSELFFTYQTSISAYPQCNKINVVIRNPALSGFASKLIDYDERAKLEIKDNEINLTGTYSSENPFIIANNFLLYSPINKIIYNNEKQIKTYKFNKNKNFLAIKNSEKFSILDSPDDNSINLKIDGTQLKTFSSYDTGFVLELNHNIPNLDFGFLSYELQSSNSGIVIEPKLIFGITSSNVLVANRYNVNNTKENKFQYCIFESSEKITNLNYLYLELRISKSASAQNLTTNESIILKNINYCFNSNDEIIDSKIIIENNFCKNLPFLLDIYNNVFPYLATYKNIISSSQDNLLINSDGHFIKTKGNTASRPTDKAVVGMEFFDTTLNKPIWWIGSKWVDATGADV